MILLGLASFGISQQARCQFGAFSEFPLPWIAHAGRGIPGSGSGIEVEHVGVTAAKHRESGRLLLTICLLHRHVAAAFAEALLTNQLLPARANREVPQPDSLAAAPAPVMRAPDRPGSVVLRRWQGDLVCLSNRHRSAEPAGVVCAVRTRTTAVGEGCLSTSQARSWAMRRLASWSYCRNAKNACFLTFGCMLENSGSSSGRWVQKPAVPISKNCSG